MIGRGTPLAVALVLVACASPPGQTTSSPPASALSASATARPTLVAIVEEASGPPPGAIEIALTYGAKFDPDEVSAQAGTVIFFLSSNPDNGPTQHNFLLGPSIDLPPLAVSPAVRGGEAIAFTVEGLDPGSYAFWCTIPGQDGRPHSENGMVGTLTLT